MIEFQTALDQLLASAKPIDRIQDRPLLEANNHVLAQDLPIKYDSPQFDNSAMDGYALCGLDLTEWQVKAQISAGDQASNISLKRGEAVQILTGAPIPKGTETVVPQENITLDGERVFVESTVDAGKNIRYQAEELKKGEPLLPANTLLTPAHIGLLASQGYSSIPTFPQLTITIFSNGNELLEPNRILGEGQIFDANRYLLISALQRYPFTIINGGILSDNPSIMRNALIKASKESDAIICSGGASVGVKDYFKSIIQEIGSLTQWRLNIKPGRPFSWGECGNCRVFMLPGNPVASLVTLNLLALPTLKKMAGYNHNEALPKSIQVTANFEVKRPNRRREFLRAQLSRTESSNLATDTALQGSHMLSGATDADLLVEIPPNTTVKKGDILTAYLLI